ncbi:MAG: preprotein translocase subunit SecE [Candidatus Taylorbacteria bacterium]
MNLSNYIKETRVEMKHVSWPTKKQAILYTIFVIIISLGVGVLLGLFDYLFTLLLKQII